MTVFRMDDEGTLAWIVRVELRAIIFGEDLKS